MTASAVLAGATAPQGDEKFHPETQSSPYSLCLCGSNLYLFQIVTALFSATVAFT